MTAPGTLPMRWRPLVALAAGLAAAAGCAIDDRTLVAAAAAAGAGGTSGGGGAAGVGPGGQGGGAAGVAAGMSGTSGQSGAGPGPGGAAGAGAAGVSGGSGQSGAAGATCLTETECDDQNPCTADDCQNSACVHIRVDALVPPVIKNNCHREVCADGQTTTEVDPTDLAPDDNNPCTDEQCSGGEPVHPPVANGKACQFGGKNGTCTDGSCIIGCQGNGECNDQSDCTDDTCENSQCQFAKKPNGTATPGVNDTHGDCAKSVCQDGTPTIVADPLDPPPSQTCTQGVCSDMMPSQSVVNNGTDCGNGNICISGLCQSPKCGDGIKNGAEECDTSDLGGQTCASRNLAPGTLTCRTTCLFDTSKCGSVCGDGDVGPGEQCDDKNTKPGDGCSAYCTVEPPPGALVITEVMINPDFSGDDVSEWFELYNTSATVTYDLRGLRLRSNQGGESHLIDAGTTPLLVEPQSYVVLGRLASIKDVPVLYAYGTSLSFANGSDAVLIEVVNGLLIDRVNWPGDVGNSPAYKGASFSLSSARLDATSNDTVSYWCPAKALISANNSDKGTPGKANAACPLARRGENRQRGHTVDGDAPPAA